LHTVASYQVPYNEGNFCNKLGTAPQGQTVGNDKGNEDLQGIQNGVLVVQFKALPLDLLGETGENERVLMAGSIAVMRIRDGGHLAASSVVALNVMWLL
jgi:hypothetical protein